MKHKRLLPYIAGLTFVILHLVACGTPYPASTPILPSTTPTSSIQSTSGEADYWPTEGWRTSTPEEQGMDSEMLANLFDLILKLPYGIHSVTVVRNGYVVVDATVHPFDQDLKHALHSATKSITSALIGIAIEQGHIESVQQPVLSFFPGRTITNLDADKEAMTLEHLLMMASGLECRDSVSYGWPGLKQMMQTDDWVQFVLDLPMGESPGTRFEYCDSASFLLSAIIQETTGMTAAAFAEAYLFYPLGISDVEWPSNPQGITINWGRLLMQPHDMAKIGYLYLNRGQWDGEQIIPASWIDASIRKHISETRHDGYGYGYQWWTTGDGVYTASGAGGQHIFVVPEHELVVVFTGNMSGLNTPFFLLNDLIIPAAKSSGPLPANPDGVTSLESKIQQVALPRAEPELVPALPEIAQRVSGQSYALDPNPLGLLSVSLTFQEETEALMSWTLNPNEAQWYLYGPTYWSQVEWPVGLDNVYRLTPGSFDIPMGLKGRWRSEETFVIHADSIGNASEYQIQFTFEGDQVAFQIVLEDWGQLVETSGRLDE